jgi:SAM-dependent methyltransferase
VKPTAPACERNKEPILLVLKQIIKPTDRCLLEIGSGTGQHAVYFAPSFPQLRWVTSDLLEQHAGIKMWLAEAQSGNIVGPVEFEIGKNDFPKGPFDLVYICNVLHIASWEKDQILFSMLGESLQSGAQVIIYGPFNYHGAFTSESNKEFDQWLKSRDPSSCLRNFEDIVEELRKHKLELVKDFEMPANNRILHFKKV